MLEHPAAMTRREVLRSTSNPSVALVRSALAGREKGLLVLEGERLIDDALRAGCEFELALVAESRAERARELEQRGIDARVADDDLLERLSALATSQGVIALARAPRPASFAAVQLGAEALVLVVAGVADPGNLGALARSAEAAGAEALVLVRGGASPWNAKALRGSMGSLLRLPVMAFETAESAARELGEHGFRQVRAATRGGAAPSEFDWTGRVALWVGSETGASPEASARFEGVTIPMRGGVESLNVTVAASLLLFAAGRAEDPRA
ncbi:MAG: RNA methyltransferase [Planctomycetes bacterium]|nr:RNA methyltransferase [Planctomycetota bacterium]